MKKASYLGFALSMVGGLMLMSTEAVAYADCKDPCVRARYECYDKGIFSPKICEAQYDRCVRESCLANEFQLEEDPFQQ